MEEINLIFPNQLFEDNPLFNYNVKTYLIEENLYFKQYKFHKKKIFFHRVSMKKYYNYCLKNFEEVEYIESIDKRSDIRFFFRELKNKNISCINYIDPCDYWLNERMKEADSFVKLNCLSTPQFINREEDNLKFFNPNKSKYFQAISTKTTQMKQLKIVAPC